MAKREKNNKEDMPVMQSEFDESVIGPGKGTGDHQAQSQNGQRVRALFAAVFNQISGGADHRQDHTNGKAQVKASEQGYIGQKQTAENAEQEEDQLPFSGRVIVLIGFHIQSSSKENRSPG